MPKDRFTCPCCGHMTLSNRPGSYEICSVCFWEDDGVQLLDPAYRGGANKPSLMECQANYQRFGASAECFTNQVRPPIDGESLDPNWRLAEDSDLRWSRTPRSLTNEEYNCLNTWYYWKREST